MTYKKTFTIVSILIVFICLTTVLTKSENVKPNRPFKDFPMKIKNWEGWTSSLDDKVYNILGVEDYILANYKRGSEETVSLYVGFYQSQKEGDIIHLPKNCMPGAGWNIAQASQEIIEISEAQKEITVIKLTLVKGYEKQIVLYWFQSRGRIIASEYMQKIWLVIDSVIKHRTDGSFVRLISPVIVDEKTTLKTLKDFAAELYPALLDFIPS